MLKQQQSNKNSGKSHRGQCAAHLYSARQQWST